MNNLPMELLDCIFDLVNIKKLVQISFLGYTVNNGNYNHTKYSDYKNYNEIPFANLNKSRIKKYWKKEAKRAWAEYSASGTYYFGAWVTETRDRWKNMGLNLGKLNSILFVCFIGNNSILKSMILLYKYYLSYKDYTMIVASQCGHLKIVKYLVKGYYDNRASNDAAIIWAHINGHDHVVEYLLGLIPKNERPEIENILEELDIKK